MKSLKSIERFFVFEMANNHMGDVEHGLRILREFREVSEGFDFDFGFKLQYRDLDTLIHPAFQNRTDIKYIKRFSETRLSADQLKRLKEEMQALGFISVCTAFDEKSVDLIEEHGFDVIKIASCSFTDWPLLERIVKTDKPVIASTAGASLEQMDNVVSFFEHREKDFALMHCVAEYPVATPNLQLNQIDLIRERYPEVVVGYSTHEDPEETEPVKLAVAKGARIFEKHVGIPTEQYGLNAYSASPSQVRRWLEAARQAYLMCGPFGQRMEFSKKETSELHSLRRGVFVSRAIHKGERIKPSDLFYAMPTAEGQVTANDVSKYSELYAEADVEAGKPLLWDHARKNDVRQKVYDILKRAKDLVKTSGVVVAPKADVEISHHYGIDRFDQFGLTMMTIVNREYCKKVIILLPGQKHPEQYHKVKEETFHILYGDVWIDLDGRVTWHKPGEVVTVERGVKHSFGTGHGAIIEEISSTHSVDDSYYTDAAIMENENRKTLLTYWLD